MASAGVQVRLTVVLDARVFGGAERQVLATVERLPPRFRVTVLAARPVPRGLAAALDDTGVAWHTTPSVVRKSQLGRFAALLTAMLRTRADLVHVNMATATNNRHAVVAARVLRRATVVGVHSLAALDSAAQRRHLRRMLAGVRVAMVPSQAIAEQLTTVLQMPPDRVVVVRNGVGEPPPGRQVRAYAGGPVRIVTVGRLSPEKGHDVLIDALRALLAAGHPAEVVVVGDGPGREELQAAAGGLPVTFTGHVADPWESLLSADVYCQPARTEGLPLALLEAMMAGLPCVATAVGDIPTLAPEVLVVAPEDPAALAAGIEGLLRDAAERSTRGAAARRRARADYTVEQAAATVVGVYDRALS